MPSQPPAAIPASGRELLEHPLPTGMRDMLPGEATLHADLGTRVTECFESFGYQRVGLPAFEYVDVVEKGLGAGDGRAMLRFVEPETGEVVALRPDMTPQIARLVSTRLRDVPAPARLCYQGSVLRRRWERARQRRQVHQCGFELIGSGEPVGDIEVLRVAARAVRAAGLQQFTLDLGYAGIAKALLAGAGAPQRAAALEALSMKDSSELLRCGKALGLSGRTVEALVQLPELHGGEAIWPRATKLLRGTPAEPACLALSKLWSWATAQELASDLFVDFGEVCRFEYYTGVTFNILATGPGEAVGSGGRYDGLFEQFGVPRPAAGFAVDLGNLSWALGAEGHQGVRRPRLLLCGGSATLESQSVVALAEALRRQAVVATFDVGADLSGDSADGFRSYGTAWGYDAFLLLSEPSTLTLEVSRGLADTRVASPETAASLASGGASQTAVFTETALSPETAVERAAWVLSVVARAQSH